MQASIYSNGSQECERAASLLKSVHLDEVVVYEKGKHFTELLEPLCCPTSGSCTPRGERMKRPVSSGVVPWRK